jgi:RNA polymerase sigma factor (TIGR02999 family)
VGAAPEEVRAADEAPLGADRLLPLAYDELCALAGRMLAHEKPGHKLECHALVHEAYLRLVGPRRAPRVYRGRGHFLAAAATAMRRILIDHARRELTRKHGGAGDGSGGEAMEAVAAPEPDEELLALADALRKLAAHEPQKVRLVELRYFGGLTGDQAAGALGISPTTADRHWAYARAWLRGEIRGGGRPKRRAGA